MTNRKRELTIMKVVCEYYHFTPEQIKEKTRKREICQTRQIIGFLCKHLLGTNCNLQSIADMTGLTEHSTINHSIKTVKNLMETDKKIASDINNLINILSQMLDLDYELTWDIIYSRFENQEDRSIKFIDFLKEFYYVPTEK